MLPDVSRVLRNETWLSFDGSRRGMLSRHVETQEHFGRGGVIRTRDPLLPKQMRYQAALRPELVLSLDLMGCSTSKSKRKIGTARSIQPDMSAQPTLIERTEIRQISRQSAIPALSI